MRRPARVFALTGFAVLALAAASTVGVAAATGAFGEHHRGTLWAAGCSVPTLPGAVVPVHLVDMRSVMGRVPMAGSEGPMMFQHDWRRFRAGMMRVLAPTWIQPGTVSLQVTNDGYLSHELVVLPLGAGQPAGARVPRADGTVSEAGSLGEASASCASGAGAGIAPGSTGWVTLHLPIGRYELICNLPGHYAAGMHAELVVP